MPHLCVVLLCPVSQVVDVSLEDGRVRANLQDERKIVVQDIVSETTDELDFRDKVIKASLGEGWGAEGGVGRFQTLIKDRQLDSCMKDSKKGIKGGIRYLSPFQF